MKSKTITGQIEEAALALLRENPEGMRWSELNAAIKNLNPEFHPKTINGTVWKLTQKYPEVSKSEGVLHLLK